MEPVGALLNSLRISISLQALLHVPAQRRCSQCCSGGKEATSGTAGHDQPSFQAARSSSAGMPGGLVTPPAHGEPQPSTAQGPPQSSPHKEEEDLDSNAKHLQGDPQPIEALGLPQSSPNEEELETIAEEPVAESRASQSQGHRPQQLNTPLDSTQQQQEAPKKEEEPGTSSAWSTDTQTGTQAQKERDGSQAKGVAGDPRNVEDEASQHSSTEARGQAGHNDSHTPSESSHHSLAGTQSSFTLPPNLHEICLPMLGWAYRWYADQQQQTSRCSASLKLCRVVQCHHRQ